MVLVVVNKSTRAIVRDTLQKLLPHAPMLAVMLKTPFSVKVVSDLPVAPPDAIALVIEDSGRFVAALVLWPVER